MPAARDRVRCIFRVISNSGVVVAVVVAAQDRSRKAKRPTLHQRAKRLQPVKR
jgi:hypothetical protein